MPKSPEVDLVPPIDALVLLAIGLVRSRIRNPKLAGFIHSCLKRVEGSIEVNKPPHLYKFRTDSQHEHHGLPNLEGQHRFTPQKIRKHLKTPQPQKK